MSDERKERGADSRAATCSAQRALECCEIWTKSDIAYYHDSIFLPNLEHRLRCIREGLEDLKQSQNAAMSDCAGGKLKS